MSIKQAKQDIRDFKRQQNQPDHREPFLDVLDTLRNRIGQSDQRASTGVREMYGPEMDRMEQRIRGNANETRSALARLSGLSGADPTGRTATSMNRIDENTNRAVGDANMQFVDRARSDRDRARSRGDQLANLLMGGTSNMMQFEDGQRRHEEQLDLMQSQANRQMLADILGAGGQIGSAALLACWVAEELYGTHDFRTYFIRSYVLQKMAANTPFGWFCRAYSMYGERWAEWVRRFPPVRRVAKAGFDRIYRSAERFFRTQNIVGG